ncbi:MAG: DUF222 domain-containing protein [Sandaracinaceae bacterium]
MEQVHALEDPSRGHEAIKRWVFPRVMPDGAHRIEAQLTADQATLVMEAIRSMQATMREEQRAGASSEVEVELPMPSLADALVRMAEHVEATKGQASASRCGADRAAIVVHFAEDRLAALTAGDASAEAGQLAWDVSAEAYEDDFLEPCSGAGDRHDGVSAEAQVMDSGERCSCAGDRHDGVSAEAHVDRGAMLGDSDGGVSAEAHVGPCISHRHAGASTEAARSFIEEVRWAATLDDGTRLSPETFRRLACDCSLIGVKLDRDGDPLDVGRKTRSIPPALWRAIVLRDKGCAFPGCTHDRYLDGHHIEHWMNGGETKKRNLVCLCSHHHHLVHEGGFRVEVEEDGRAAFFDPRGVRLTANGWTAPQRSIVELRQAVVERQVELGIDDETAFPMWDGSTPDYSYCVDTILGVERTARRAGVEAVGDSPSAME